MESISSNLHSFLKKTSKNLSLPEKKFLRDALIGLLRAGNPIVCQRARQLPDQRTKFISRLDRLDEHLLKHSNFDENVKETLPGLWLPYLQDDTPIILDLSDLAQRLAKKMDYLATVGDGSTGEQTPTPHRFYKLVKRKDKPSLRISQIGWLKVRLPGKEENLTLVVCRLAGCDKPLMLLTNLPVENVDDAKRVLRYYVRRWECEEAIRFLQSQVHLEKIRTFRWSAICRLVLLATLVMIYLGWIVEEHPELGERLIRFGQPLPSKPEFLVYRLLTGLTEVINACFWLRRNLL